MVKLRSEAILPVGAERYWLTMRNNKDFHRFEDKYHKTKSRTMVSMTHDDNGRLVAARSVTLPDMKQVDLPSFLKNMLPGGQLALTDEWRIVEPPDNGAYCTIVFSISPNVYTKECTVRGRASFFQLDNGYCRHVVDATIKADIFLVGSVLESAMAERIRDGHKRQPSIVAEYLKYLESLDAPAVVPSPALPALASGQSEKDEHAAAAVATSATETNRQQQKQTPVPTQTPTPTLPQARTRSPTPTQTLAQAPSQTQQQHQQAPGASPRGKEGAMPGREATELRHLLRAYHSQRFRYSAPAHARTHWDQAHSDLRARAASVALGGTSAVEIPAADDRVALDTEDEGEDRGRKHAGSLAASPTDSMRQPPRKVATTEPRDAGHAVAMATTYPPADGTQGDGATSLLTTYPRNGSSPQPQEQQVPSLAMSPRLDSMLKRSLTTHTVESLLHSARKTDAAQRETTTSSHWNNIPHVVSSVRHPPDQQSRSAQRGASGRRVGAATKAKKKAALEVDDDTPWHSLLAMAFNPRVWDELLDEFDSL